MIVIILRNCLMISLEDQEFHNLLEKQFLFNWFKSKLFFA